MYTYIFHNPLKIFQPGFPEKTGVLHILFSKSRFCWLTFAAKHGTLDTAQQKCYSISKGVLLFMVKIGEKLKSLRNEKKMTQKDEVNPK